MYNVNSSAVMNGELMLLFKTETSGSENKAVILPVDVVLHLVHKPKFPNKVTARQIATNHETSCHTVKVSLFFFLHGLFAAVACS